MRSLVGRELASRSTDSRDRRVVRLRATDEAASTHDDFAARWAEPIRSTMKDMDDDDVAAITAAGGALRRLDEILRTRSTAGPAARSSLSL